LLESFTRGAKGFVRIDALNSSATKFLKPSLSLCKPNLFRARIHFIVKGRYQTLRKLHTISQRELHRIRRELIQVGTHALRITNSDVSEKNLSGLKLGLSAPPPGQAPQSVH
jgi:hypothetical protein